MQELGKLWGELFSVVWTDVCKRILKMQRGEKKPKHTFEQLQAEQSRSRRGAGVPYPAEAQQLLRFVGTQELPQGYAVSELAPPEGLEEKHICGCEDVLGAHSQPALPRESSAQSSSSPSALSPFPICLQ